MVNWAYKAAYLKTTSTFLRACIQNFWIAAHVNIPNDSFRGKAVDGRGDQQAEEEKNSSQTTA